MHFAGSSKTVILKMATKSLQEETHVDHDLTLVIPAYNEEARLPRTLADAKSYLDAWGINYRVLVVDDGSRDETAKLTEAFGRRFSTIRQTNGGKGSAIRNGMMSSSGKVIGFTDADLPYDLDALKTAYQIIETGRRDVVFGSRTIEGATSRVERRLMRTLASFVFRTCMMCLVSREITDTQCGLKVFSRRAARMIFSRTIVNGFAFDAEVVYLTHLLNLSFEKVAVTLVNDYSTTISLTRNAIPMLIDVVGVRLHGLRNGYHPDIEVLNPTSAATTPARKAA
ncbi:glycosyltransferase [Schlesneria sp. T3-172]|uniref:glycosyltransferase n=1 Tax=Schlesneria sphaerica TaxID=3373610 RepID=UPI0037CC7169